MTNNSRFTLSQNTPILYKKAKKNGKGICLSHFSSENRRKIKSISPTGSPDGAAASGWWDTRGR
jgi:hypothetical protein